MIHSSFNMYATAFFLPYCIVCSLFQLDMHLSLALLPFVARAFSMAAWGAEHQTKQTNNRNIYTYNIDIYLPLNRVEPVSKTNTKSSKTASTSVAKWSWQTWQLSRSMNEINQPFFYGWNIRLVGGFNPFQIGLFPRVEGWKKKTYLKPPPSKHASMIQNVSLSVLELICKHNHSTKWVRYLSINRCIHIGYT